jgi:hypothetical protein
MYLAYRIVIFSEIYHIANIKFIKFNTKFADANAASHLLHIYND